MKKYIYLLSLIVFAACDTITGDYLEDTENVLNSHAVILEFTGMKCTYCPKGHREVESIKTIYGTQVQSVAIHAGSFAEPDDKYTADYRCQAGIALFELMEPQGFPTGTINSMDKADLSSPTSWATTIQQLGKETPNVLISVSKEISDNKIEAILALDFSGSAVGEIHLVCYLVEDEVIGKQIDNGEEIEEYTHQHMLRASLNGDLGEQIGTNISAGTIIKKNYSMQINSNWKADNLKLVAFVYDKSSKKLLSYRLIKE